MKHPSKIIIFSDCIKFSITVLFSVWDFLVISNISLISVCGVHLHLWLDFYKGRSNFMFSLWRYIESLSWKQVLPPSGAPAVCAPLY